MADFDKQSRAVLLRHGPAPEEIADAVLYLARARSVTGQLIAVDGGQHLAWETPDMLGIKECKCAATGMSNYSQA